MSIEVDKRQTEKNENTVAQ